MSGELTLSVEAVTAHAARVDDVVGRAGAGVEAAHELQVGPDAFGLLCRPLAAALVPAQGVGLVASSAALGALGLTAAQARMVAELVAATDHGVSARMVALGGELPR